MFGSEILDVAIGMIFVYLFLSIISSVITEWISKQLEMRAKNLEEGIRSLLNDPEGTGIALAFYNHPLIKGLSQDGKKPSYIPSPLFAVALMDIIAPSDPLKGPKTFDEVRGTIHTLPSPDLQKTISSLLDDAEISLKKARENFEKWFDEAMDRVSGWYKRKLKPIVFVTALVVTVALNADTLSITKTLFQDPTLRAGLVTAAQEISKQPVSTSEDAQKRMKQIDEEMKKLEFPIGWTKTDLGLFTDFWQSLSNNFWQILTKAIGLFLTVLAVSLGAPFWFDMLNKFINIRSAGAKPEKAKKQLEE